MTGEQAYGTYREMWRLWNGRDLPEPPPWEALSGREQRVWEGTAAEVAAKDEEDSQ